MVHSCCLDNTRVRVMLKPSSVFSTVTSRRSSSNMADSVDRQSELSLLKVLLIRLSTHCTALGLASKPLVTSTKGYCDTSYIDSFQIDTFTNTVWILSECAHLIAQLIVIWYIHDNHKKLWNSTRAKHSYSKLKQNSKHELNVVVEWYITTLNDNDGPLAYNPFLL